MDPLKIKLNHGLNQPKIQLKKRIKILPRPKFYNQTPSQSWGSKKNHAGWGYQVEIKNSVFGITIDQNTVNMGFGHYVSATRENNGYIQIVFIRNNIYTGVLGSFLLVGDTGDFSASFSAK